MTAGRRRAPARGTGALSSLALAALLSCAARLDAQAAAGHAAHHAPPAAQRRLDSLAAESARRTAHYADRRAAVADGYRRIGTDFPGMGEHWLHPGALLAGDLDPARPTLLSYATIAGRPTLLGLAFVVTTRGDEAADVPGWPDTWHEHSGLLADESGAGAAHPADAEAKGRTPATRVWVLHAWMALENPDGRYAADNWALPFVRAGLAAPAGVDADVGRACSLVVGGDAYLRGVLTDAGLAEGGRAAAIDAAIGRARAEAGAIVARGRTAGGVRPADVTALRTVWDALSTSLRATIGAEVEPFLAPPHAPAHRTGAH